MPRVTIDTSEAKSFEPVEPGPYSMTIRTVEPKKSKEGQAMLNVAFKFDDPSIDQKAGLVYRNYMLEGKGAGFTREFVKAVTGEDIPIGGSFDIDTDDFLARPVTVQISNREYEGRLQNEAGRVVAAS